MVCSQDKRLVPGGGATEIELAKQITSYGEVQQMGFLTFYIHKHMYLNIYVTYKNIYILFYIRIRMCINAYK